MRAFIRNGLAFIALVLFSVHLNADVVDCDTQLKPYKELKPLYGLCVAYWSAGADDALPLLDLYREKAEKLANKFPDLDVPSNPPGFGNTDTCPCRDIDAVRQILACEGWLFIDGGLDSKDDYLAAFLNLKIGDLATFSVGPYTEDASDVTCEATGAAESMVYFSGLIVEGAAEQACYNDVDGLVNAPPVPVDCPQQ